MSKIFILRIRQIECNLQSRSRFTVSLGSLMLFLVALGVCLGPTHGKASDLNDVTNNEELTATKECPDGWLLITPRLAHPGQKPFCVMKFEAQNPLGPTAAELESPDGTPSALFRSQIPESRPNGNPWTNISRDEAETACKRIVFNGKQAHLITLWQTKVIADKVATTASNWQSGVAGTSCLYGGHMDHSPYNILPSADDDHPYLGTNDSDEHSEPVCPYRLYDSGRAARRTLEVDGQTLHDFVGNVWSWLRDDCDSRMWSALAGGHRTSFIRPDTKEYVMFAGGYLPLSGTYHPTVRNAILYTRRIPQKWFDEERSVSTAVKDQLHSIAAMPLDGPGSPLEKFITALRKRVRGAGLPDFTPPYRWGIEQGMGGFWGCANGAGGILHGGAYYNAFDAGPYMLQMGHSPKFRHEAVGFRCAIER